MALNFTPSTNTVLENWNRLEQDAAMHVILPCNGSRAWAIGVVNLYPFNTPADLFTASDKVWASLSEHDRDEAFRSHPRIGDKTAAATATAQSATWSEQEQSAAAANADTDAKLAAANQAYEAKFHRTFIVCATGKTPEHMLAILEQRLHNDAATELREASEQQRQITQLRLRKWLGITADPAEVQ